jgi:signal-transduction protein with cAMP-binding, CBS, and nucleotidyltransferase domain
MAISQATDDPVRSGSDGPRRRDRRPVCDPDPDASLALVGTRSTEETPVRSTIAPSQPVSTIATRVVAEVDSAQSLRSVAEELVADEIGVVLVRAPGHRTGLISERDLVTVLAMGGDPWTGQATDVMTLDLITAAPTDTVAEVGRRMLDSGIRHVVVQDDGEVVGVVSIRDVLRSLLEGQPA